MTLRERARGIFELGRAHVVGGRVDEVAREQDAFGNAGEVGAVDAGQFEPQLFVVLAIAREAIGPEREGERRKPASCGALAKR